MYGYLLVRSWFMLQYYGSVYSSVINDSRVTV